MKEGRDIDREVDRTLELLDGWEKKTVGEDFWHGVRGRMKEGRGRHVVWVRPAWQLALLAVLFVVNVLFGLAAASGVMKSDQPGQVEMSEAVQVEADDGLEDFRQAYGLAEEESEWNY